eukprot:6492535-Amphidinium_carterae.2
MSVAPCSRNITNDILRNSKKTVAIIVCECVVYMLHRYMGSQIKLSHLGKLKTIVISETCFWTYLLQTLPCGYHHDIPLCSKTTVMFNMVPSLNVTIYGYRFPVERCTSCKLDAVVQGNQIQADSSSLY